MPIKKSLVELEENYDLELDRIVLHIKREKAKRVLLQFPEGLKLYSQVICDFIIEKTGIECFIWLDSCFGACDLPIETERLGIDLIIQFGHSNWSFSADKKIKVLK